MIDMSQAKPNPELEKELVEAMRKGELQRVTVSPFATASELEGSQWPANPEEGVTIVGISRGKSRGRGWNAMYSRPGRSVHAGQNRHFFFESVEAKSVSYQQALDWCKEVKTKDIAFYGEITPAEREAEKRLPRTVSRRSASYAMFNIMLDRIEKLSEERRVEECEKIGVEASGEQAVFALIRHALDMAFGKGI